MTIANGSTASVRHHQAIWSGQGGTVTATQICPTLEPAAAMR
jgi:hypothetical protein